MNWNFKLLLIASISLTILAKNPYQILGLDYGATIDEAKKAFRKLSLEYHPDKNDDPKAEQMYKEITQAYQHIVDGGSKFNTPFNFDPFGFKKSGHNTGNAHKQTHTVYRNGKYHTTTTYTVYHPEPKIRPNKPNKQNDNSQAKTGKPVYRVRDPSERKGFRAANSQNQQSPNQ